MLASKRINLAEYEKTGSPESVKPRIWIKRFNPEAKGYTDAYFSDDLIRALDRSDFSNTQKVVGLATYRPPVYNLTDEDFIDWIKNGDLDTNSVNMWARWYGYDAKPWFYSLIESRSPATFDWKSESCLTKALAKNDPKKPFIHWFIYLNEYLGEQNCDLTLQEYINRGPNSETMKDNLDNLIFSNTSWLEDIFSVNSNKSVLNITNQAQVRTQKLLLGQKQEFWKKALVQKKYKDQKKGTSHAYVEKFVETINENKIDKIRPPEAVKADIYNFLAKKVANSHGRYADKTFNNIARQAFLFPIFEYGYLFNTHLSEFDKVIKFMIANEDDFDIKKTLGVLTALLLPKTWIRGNAENGPLLLQRLLEHESSSDYVEHIASIVFEHQRDIPSEREWKKSMEEANQEIPTEMFLIFTAQPKSRGNHRGAQDYVKILRSLKI